MKTKVESPLLKWHVIPSSVPDQSRLRPGFLTEGEPRGLGQKLGQKRSNWSRCPSPPLDKNQKSSRDLGVEGWGEEDVVFSVLFPGCCPAAGVGLDPEG